MARYVSATAKRVTAKLLAQLLHPSSVEFRKDRKNDSVTRSSRAPAHRCRCAGPRRARAASRRRITWSSTRRRAKGWPARAARSGARLPRNSWFEAARATSRLAPLAPLAPLDLPPAPLPRASWARTTRPLAPFRSLITREAGRSHPSAS